MGFKISVNGEEVWESEGEPLLVDKISISNAGGEVAVVNSSNLDAYLNIDVNVRSYEAPESYLDMIEAKAAQERRDMFEPGGEHYKAPVAEKTEEDFGLDTPAEDKPAEETVDLEF